MSVTILDFGQPCRTTGPTAGVRAVPTAGCRLGSMLGSWATIGGAAIAVAVHISCLTAVAQSHSDSAAAATDSSPSTADEARPLDGHRSRSDVNVAITPYIWLNGVSGTVGQKGLTMDVSSPFIDILRESDSLFGFMGALDVEYRRFVFQFNGTYTYVDISDQRGTARDGLVDITSNTELDLKLDTLWLEFFGGYRFVDTSLAGDRSGGGSAERLEAPTTNVRLTLDGFVGGRVTWMRQRASVVSDVTVTLPRGRVLEAGQQRNVTDEESWIEPFVGGRAIFGLGDNWEIALRGDVGGFSVDNSKFSWQIAALVGYRWQHDGWSIALFGGYRALSQDYSSDGFVWDATAHGPLLGASFQFTF